jgi:hypothetical protein
MYLSGLPEPGDEDVVSLLVVLNVGPAAERFRLPDEQWGRSYHVLLDTCDERPAPGPTHDSGRELTLGPHSLVVLAARRAG